MFILLVVFCMNGRGSALTSQQILFPNEQLCKQAQLKISQMDSSRSRGYVDVETSCLRVK